MASHSSLVGGSTASRLIKCPASYQSTVTLPPSTNLPSPYAEEGTFAHAVMELVMGERATIPPGTHSDKISMDAAGRWLIKFAEKLIGTTIYDREFTRAHLDEMIAPAILELMRLEAEYGGGFEVFGIERQVKFPGIIGSFGTCDVIMRNDKYVLLVDWKFGSGVPVVAFDGDTNTINPQLMFYLTAAKATLPKIFTGGRAPVVAIIQPRAEMHKLSHYPVTSRQVKKYKDALHSAVIDALRPQPHRERGEHCRFAPCKLTCPLWTGPLIDLSRIAKVPAPPKTTREPTAFGAYLAHAKNLIDQVHMLKKEVEEQMHAYLEAGGSIPGWRLKHKNKLRQWVDIDTVEAELRKLGFKDEEIWTPKLNTFAQTDAVARRLGVKIPEELRVAPPTDETTLATADDPAPVVDRTLAMEQFQASLKLLRQAGAK